MPISPWKKSKMYVPLHPMELDEISSEIARITGWYYHHEDICAHPSIIEAEEAEEIGVEHLLRDIRDVAVGTLSTRVTAQLQSLQGLHLRLRDIGQYLQKVLDRDLPVNHAILGNLQDVFNLLPNLSTPKSDSSSAAAAATAAAPHSAMQLENGIEGPIPPQTDNGELARAMSVKTNDQLMAIYLSSLIRAITAFHDLIDNKIQNRQQQEDKENKKDEAGAAAAAGGKDGAGSKVNGVATNGAGGVGSGGAGENKDDGAAGGEGDKGTSAKDADKERNRGKDKDGSSGSKSGKKR